MNQPVLQAPLETKGEFPRNPVDDINIDTEDVESEEKNHNEGEVIIRCRFLRFKTSAWFSELSKSVNNFNCIYFSFTGRTRAAVNVL